MAQRIMPHFRKFDSTRSNTCGLPARQLLDLGDFRPVLQPDDAHQVDKTDP